MNTYKTHGVCSREIRFEIKDGKIIIQKALENKT